MRLDAARRGGFSIPLAAGAPRWLLLAAALLLSCSSDPAAPPKPAAFCASDPRVADFSLGLQAVCPDGKLQISIDSAAPDPVIQGVNDWVISVRDGAGQPVDGATIDVKPTMPDHGHGSPTRTTVTPRGGGQYALDGINLSMRGVWLITLDVTAGPVTDTATYTFCVDGS